MTDKQFSNAITKALDRTIKSDFTGREMLRSDVLNRGKELLKHNRKLSSFRMDNKEFWIERNALDTNFIVIYDDKAIGSIDDDLRSIGMIADKAII